MLSLFFADENNDSDGNNGGEPNNTKTNKISSSFPPIEFSFDDIIRLPRSFGPSYRRQAEYEPSPLIVSPKNEPFRSSSVTYPSLTDFYNDTSFDTDEAGSNKRRKEVVKKTHSDGSIVDILRGRNSSTDDSPLQGSLTPEQLQSHMTDILEWVFLVIWILSYFVRTLNWHGLS